MILSKEEIFRLINYILCLIPILACYIGLKIASDDRPRIAARVKPIIFQTYKDINNDNKI